MITTSTRVEDAKLRGMLTSCEGVTPGPWSRHDSLQETSVLSEVHSVVVVPWGRGGLSLHNAHRDAEFIANCDPDTIRSILSELLDLREAVKPFAALAVRPLKWEPSGRYPFVAMSDYYDIGHQSGDGRYWVHHRIFGDLREGDGTIEHHLTLDAAKAAAQEDHERKILWQIVGSSDPDVAPPNVEHLRPLADREKSAALVSHEEPAGDTQGAAKPVAWRAITVAGNVLYFAANDKPVEPSWEIIPLYAAPAALVSPPDNGEPTEAEIDDAVRCIDLGVSAGIADTVNVGAALRRFVAGRAALQSHNEGSE